MRKNLMAVVVAAFSLSSLPSFAGQSGDVGANRYPNCPNLPLAGEIPSSSEYCIPDRPDRPRPNPVPSLPSPLPPMMEMFRFYNQAAFEHYTGFYARPGFIRESSLGFVKTAPTPDTRGLYACSQRNNGERFTSLDVGCEGHYPAPVYVGRSPTHLIGYISSGPQANTTPLFRCLVSGNHFESFSASCENAWGVVNEGILGYVFL